ATRREEITAAQMDRARNPRDLFSRSLDGAVKNAPRFAEKRLFKVASKALDAVANLVGGLLSFFFPDAPKTKEHIARIVDEKERTAEAKGIEADRAACRAAYDHRHGQIMK